MLAAFAQVDTVWPATVAGWVALAASIIALVLYPIAFGKSRGRMLEQMNGLGRRTAKVEKDYERIDVENSERRREIDRVLAQHEEILRIVGEAKRSAEQCREDATDHSLRIGVQVSETLAAVTKMELRMAERLTALETELRMRRGGAQ